MQNFWYWEKRVSVDQHLHRPLHCKIYITLGQTQTGMKFLQLFTCTRDEIISRSEICCHLHETCTRISCLNPPTKMKSDKSEFIFRPVSCKRTVSCKYPTHTSPPPQRKRQTTVQQACEYTGSTDGAVVRSFAFPQMWAGIRFPDLVSRVGWVCWFSTCSLLREAFLWVL